MNEVSEVNDLLENAKGEPVPTVKSLTLGLKSRISLALLGPIAGISFVYLSEVYELTENKSPVTPDDTSYLSKITNNFLEGIADFPFLTILE